MSTKRTKQDLARANKMLSREARLEDMEVVAQLLADVRTERARWERALADSKLPDIYVRLIHNLAVETGPTEPLADWERELICQHCGSSCCDRCPRMTPAPATVARCTTRDEEREGTE